MSEGSEKSGKAISYEALKQLPIIRQYAAAFRKATGISLLLARPESTATHGLFASGDNPFCQLVSRSSTGCSVCRGIEGDLLRRVAMKGDSQLARCFAGSTVVAVPVVVAGKHVATLLGGPMSCQSRNRRSFAPLANLLSSWGLKRQLPRARQAYLGVQVVSRQQLGGIVELVSILARHLADYGSRCLLDGNGADPPCVARAKQFANGKATGRVSLKEIANHVHLSSFYFCKIFKQATGMTFTEYLSRVRVEKAKELLLDTSRRVSEVAFAAGFGSIPQFNSIFKRHVGRSPSQYRASLRADRPV